MNKETIGLRIKRIRKQKNLTQTDLANLLGYKDKSMIAHIENGDSDMAYDKLILLVKKLNIDANDLFIDISHNAFKKKDVPDKIGPFKRYIKKPTTMEYGYYYILNVTLPFSKENKRTIRVWLPEDYDFENKTKKFPVIYMSDGQNLVDKYLSAFGEWELDKTVHKLKQKGFPSVIAVGIDCPKDPLERTKELCPPFIPRKEIFEMEGASFTPYGDKYVNYIIYNLKRIIDTNFHTLSDRNNTAIGGSSMGGIMSFYAYMYKPEVFGFSLSFSPAFFFYNEEDWYNILNMHDIKKEKNGKLFLYSGGTDFESKFLRPACYTFRYFLNKNFDQKQIALYIDSEALHNEEAWAKRLPDALKFWLKSK